MKSITDPYYIKIKNNIDDKGILSVLDEIPFDVKRVFYTSGKDHNDRGGHAHKECNQIYISLCGNIEIEIFNGEALYTLLLEEKGDAICVPAMVWSTQKNMSDSDLLFVLCSHTYREDEYIKSIDKYRYILKGSD